MTHSAASDQPSRALVLTAGLVGLPFVLLEGLAGFVLLGSALLPQPGQMHPDTMSWVSERVEIYALRKGRLPSSDDGLAAVFGEEVPKDSWGNPILYVGLADDFELISLGRDGRPGGQGEDADVYYRPGRR